MEGTNTMPAPTLADIATLPRWVAWRTEPQRGTGRITKVPKSPATLAEAASTRPDTWGTRAAAEAADQRLPPSRHGPGGIGIILGDWQDGHRIGGVDLDACRDPETGTVEPWARDVLAMLDTYAEISPSGTGIKALFTMEPGAVSALRDARLLERDGFGRSFKRGTGMEHPPAIEAHLGGRYYTVTDDRLPDARAELRSVPTAALRRLLGEIGPAFARGLDDRVERPDRSAKAFRQARRTYAEGGDYAAFVAALDGDPDTAAWKQEKGTPRELRRAWENACKIGPEDWPVPDLALVTADTLPAPMLPLHLFPGRWRAWIERAAQRAGSPPDYVAVSLLAVVGATLGNARWGSPWPGWTQPPAVNVACIGTPATGKSPGIDAAATPLSDLAADLNDDWEERQREFRSARQEAKERRAAWEADVKEAVRRRTPPPREPEGAREPEEPKKRRAYTTDATMEAARDLSAANPRGLLLHRDELAGWLSGMGRYGNGDGGTDRAFWLQAYEGRRWSSARVKDGDNAPEIPHLTWGILGGFQPDRLASTLLSGDDDGLAARFLYTWPAPPADVSPRPDGTPLPFDMQAALRRMRELPMPESKPVVLPFDDAAADALQDWRREVKAMEADAAGLFLSWSGKLPGFAVRLAVIFAHMAWIAAPDGTPPPERLTLDDLARALGFLADYAVPMARRAFGEAALPDAERDARRFARWYLRQTLPRPAILNARKLRREGNGPGIASAERIEAALAELAELGLVRRAPGREGGGTGRPRADWAVNPLMQDAAL
jgi:hypothetical protein